MGLRPLTWLGRLIIALLQPSRLLLAFLLISGVSLGMRNASGNFADYFAPPREAPLLGDYQTRGEVDSAMLTRCANLVQATLAVLPPEHGEAIDSLTFSFDPNARRGLGGGNTLELRCVDVSDAELVAVLVHEVGHVVDTGLLHATLPPSAFGQTFLGLTDTKTQFVDRGQAVYGSDPSVQLYSVSWTNDRFFSGKEADAVSGYATTNPYEEFAESYAMYVLHGPLFRAYAEGSDGGAGNEALQKKYDFMKETVFKGKEFVFGRESLPLAAKRAEGVEADRRVYDVTRLPYDLESFLAS